MTISKNSSKKYPASVGYFCWRTAGLILLALIIDSCVHPPKAPPPSPVETAPIVAPRKTATATVIAVRENVRSFPQGPIVSEVRKGDQVTMASRRGNWIHCQIGDTLDGYIWAPSLGFPKISYVDLHSYFPGTDFGLIRLDTLIQWMGSPSEINQESPHYQRALYINTPENGRRPFGTTEFSRLELSVAQGLIAEVVIEYGAKQIRQTDLLTQMGLSDEHPTYTGFQEVVWDNVFKGLGRVALQRAGGSFTSFSGIRAYKVNPERWKKSLTLTSQSCQIGKNDAVSIHMIVENADSMAYSDMEFDLSFYDRSKLLIYQMTIGPLPDIILPQGSGEIFVDRIIPELSGRTDSNYIIRITSARSLFVSSTP